MFVCLLLFLFKINLLIWKTRNVLNTAPFSIFYEIIDKGNVRCSNHETKSATQSKSSRNISHLIIAKRIRLKDIATKGATNFKVSKVQRYHSLFRQLTVNWTWRFSFKYWKTAATYRSFLKMTNLFALTVYGTSLRSPVIGFCSIIDH